MWSFFWLSCLAGLCAASFDSPHRYSHAPSARSNTIASGIPLRILPLGDSITWGEGSGDGNGYRLRLQEKLSTTNKVEYIGSMKHGTMANNNMEGHRGFPIGAIRDMGKKRYSERPNVVLLIAGTNNVVFGFSPSKAPVELGELIDEIMESCPDATVLIATLPPLLLDATKSKQVDNINAKLPGILDKYTRSQKHVALVDMKEITPDDIQPDKIHPQDSGYRIMAQNWYHAITEAGKQGWITPPVRTNTTRTAANASLNASAVLNGTHAPNTKPLAKIGPHSNTAEGAAASTSLMVFSTTVTFHAPEALSSEMTEATMVSNPPGPQKPSDHSEGSSADKSLSVGDKQSEHYERPEQQYPSHDTSGQPGSVILPASPVSTTERESGYNIFYYFIGALAVLGMYNNRRHLFGAVTRYKPIPQ